MRYASPVDLQTLPSLVLHLFLVVDPVGCIPLFAAITHGSSPARRRRTVTRAVLVALAVLVAFAWAGTAVLSRLGIGLPAVRIAGGILLFLIGLEMLWGRVSRTETTPPEEEEAAGKDDVSITPLAIPLLAGPGSITAVMLLGGPGRGAGGAAAVTLATALVLGASWLLLTGTDVLLRLLGQIGIRVVSRVMGLLLLFLSTQMVVDGVRGAGLAP